jgi:hypothetical protein
VIAEAPEAETEQPPLSTRAKKRAREEHEASVRAAEQAKLGESAPASADDFERLLLGSPNSSYLWIRYMSFHLQTAQVEQARAVAERALEKIDLRYAFLKRSKPTATRACCDDSMQILRSSRDFLPSYFNESG